MTFIFHLPERSGRPHKTPPDWFPPVDRTKEPFSPSETETLST
jgi:hypothetical protein